jgi:hypothetical protein
MFLQPGGAAERQRPNLGRVSPILAWPGPPGAFSSTEQRLTAVLSHSAMRRCWNLKDCHRSVPCLTVSVVAVLGHMPQFHPVSSLLFFTNYQLFLQMLRGGKPSYIDISLITRLVACTLRCDAGTASHVWPAGAIRLALSGRHVLTFHDVDLRRFNPSASPKFIH